MTEKFSLAYWAGKLVVRLHYTQKLDIYSLPSIHAPELWAKSQRKAKIPTSTRWLVWRRDNFTCVYCNTWGHNLSLDHVVPEVHGGNTDAKNLVTSCAKCNAKKGSMSFDEFLRCGYLCKKRHQNGLTTTPQGMAELKQQILDRTGTNS